MTRIRDAGRPPSTIIWRWNEVSATYVPIWLKVRSARWMPMVAEATADCAREPRTQP